MWPGQLEEMASMATTWVTMATWVLAPTTGSGSLATTWVATAAMAFEDRKAPSVLKGQLVTLVLSSDFLSIPSDS